VTVALVGSALPLADVSKQYGEHCASCHGSQAQGGNGYPALMGSLLSEDEFVRVVRTGEAGGMPAFGPELIDDATLRADHAQFVSPGKASDSTTTATQNPSVGWSEADIERHYREGLTVWRTPDDHGAACAGCHSPDAIDLALIGYPDDAILRRAALHLPAEQGRILVDFVAAQRRRFHIDAPCDPMRWRPFQPGGEVLPGETANEQDLALSQHLQSLGLLIAIGQIDSLQAAHRAEAELAALDLRRVRLGIVLPRWSEDGFHGEEHRTVNDWLPEVARMPSDPAAYYALADAYVANPSDENFAALEIASDKAFEDGKFGETYPAEWAGRPGNFGWLPDIMRQKHGAVLYAQHFFRAEALRRTKWYDQPIAVAKPGPFSWLAARNAESACGGSENSDCNRGTVDSFPLDIREDNPTNADFWKDVQSRMAHPWFIVAELYDQRLSDNKKGAPHSGSKYWHGFNFSQVAVHQPFLAAHRLIQQARYFDSQPRSQRVLPLLDGAWLMGEFSHGGSRNDAFSVGFSPANRSENADRDAMDPLFAPTVRLRVNLARMFLYLQAELLEQGEPVGIEADSHFHNFVEHAGRVVGSAVDLNQLFDEKDVMRPYPELLADRDFLVTGTRVLAERVVELARAAPQIRP